MNEFNNDLGGELMQDNIRIMKRTAEISSLSLTLFKRGRLSCKFKTRLYYEGFNSILTYFHSEYVFKSKRSKEDRMVNLSPNSFIHLEASDENKNKFSILISEVARNKLLRKIHKMVAVLEAYETEELDLIDIDDGEAYITNKYGDIYSQISISKHKVEFNVIIRDKLSDIGVSLHIDNIHIIDLSIHDFLDIMYKIKNVNYMSMTMQMILYLRRPDVGQYETDFRKTYDTFSSESFDQTEVKSSSSDINGLSKVPRSDIVGGKNIW